MARRLIIIRGNSGSGKSTVARELQQRLGYGTALIEQNHIRRKLLRVKDTPGNPAIALINLNARYALDQGYDVIIEGIMSADRYRDMLQRLLTDYPHCVYYFDIPFDETLRRHQTRDKTEEFGDVEMRRWWREYDVLSDDDRIISQAHSCDEIVQRIIDDLQVP